MKLRSFMIASTGSGRGKTTITCALHEAYKRRGLNLLAYKTGPDFIDPMFHSEVVGVPSKNLDRYFTDRDLTKQLFWEENRAQLSIVEGAMGLYDGFDPKTAEGSAYDVATTLGIPIVLVVDARGMGRSILAEIKGFLEYDTYERIVGVIFNRMSSGYYETMKTLVQRSLHVKVCGYFPADEDASVSSRYLGLKLPNEIDDLHARLARAADTVEKTIDLDALLEIAETYSPEYLYVNRGECPPAVKIAVARDPAFCFYYEDNLRALRRSGAELVEFSPLNNEPLPENVDGLLVGGGYPELYAAQLEAAQTSRESIRRALDAGIPCLAECGGFMYLHDRIIADDGTSYAMAGYIPGKCYNTGKLTRFGYVELTENSSNFFDGVNKKYGCGYFSSIRGHEFHYYDSDNNGEDCTATKPTGKKWSCAHVSKNQWLGFAHLYYESNEKFASIFVEHCEEYKKSQGRR